MKYDLKYNISVDVMLTWCMLQSYSRDLLLGCNNLIGVKF